MSHLENVEIIETSPLEREVQIAVDGESVDRECEKALAQLRGRVKVRGFRPGKVPRRELVKRYGASVRRDVVKTLLQRTLSEALNREDLKSVLHVSPPEVTDDPGKGGFAYRFRAEVRPEITPTGYLGMVLEAPPVEVSEERVSQELERLREQHAIVEPIEDREVAEADDWVTISYRALDDDGSAGEGVPSDWSLDLSDERAPAGLREAIIGLRVGETTETQIAPPSDEAEEAAAEPRRLSVTLEAIKRRVLPELDDELAELVGDFDSLEALREEIARQLEAREEWDRRRELKRQLEERLISQADFEVPAGYLGSRQDDELRSQVRRMGEGLESNAELMASLREQMAPEVERRVRLEFMLGAIAEREGVTLGEAELDQAVEELVRSAGEHASVLRTLYSQPAYRTSLAERLRLDKTLDFLLSKATISGEGPSGAGDSDAAASESEAESPMGEEEPPPEAVERPSAAAAGGDAEAEGD